MFAEKIRQLREDRQLLQREISAALEIDNALYCKIERGDRIAKRELLNLWLADKVYDIVNGEENINDILNIVAEKIANYEKGK